MEGRNELRIGFILQHHILVSRLARGIAETLSETVESPVRAVDRKEDVTKISVSLATTQNVLDENELSQLKRKVDQKINMLKDPNELLSKLR